MIVQLSFKSKLYCIYSHNLWGALPAQNRLFWQLKGVSQDSHLALLFKDSLRDSEKSLRLLEIKITQVSVPAILASSLQITRAKLTNFIRSFTDTTRHTSSPRTRQKATFYLLSPYIDRIFATHPTAEAAAASASSSRCTPFTFARDYLANIYLQESVLLFLLLLLASMR